MPRTILIAAADPNIIYLLQRYAEESGFKTFCCSSEKDLLCQVKNLHPDLVVLQIEPEDSTWQQALKVLKSDPATLQVPVVAYSYLEEINRDQVNGISSIIQKSILFSDFVSALQQAGVSID